MKLFTVNEIAPTSDQNRKIRRVKLDTGHTTTTVTPAFQPTTFLSDGVLALLSCFGAYLVARKTFLSYSGFLLLASAAVLGTIKFAGITQVTTFHRLASEVAEFVGVPAIFIGIYHREKTLEQLRTSVIILGVLIVLYLVFACGFKLKNYRIVVGLVAVLAAVYESVIQSQLLIFFGILFFVAAGSLIGNEGKLFGLRRVDLLHYILALGCILVSYGVTRLP